MISSLFLVFEPSMGLRTGFFNIQPVEQWPHAENTEIVLYCGCCPFDICPNIRPAFSLLNEKGFTDHKLLDLTENIKVDWIDRGYPVSN